MLTNLDPSNRSLPERMLEADGTSAKDMTENLAMAAFFFAYQMSLTSTPKWLRCHSGNAPLRLTEHLAFVRKLFGPVSHRSSPLSSTVLLEEFDSLHDLGRTTMDEILVPLHVQALIALGLFIPMARTWCELGGPYVSLIPPELIDLPLASLMACSPPFRTLSSKDFIRQYVERVTEPEFLEDGEWVGYYCYSIGGLSTTPQISDSEMKGVYFRTVPEGSNGILQLTSKGQDGVGPFTLTGRVSGTTGLLLMNKVYEGGHPTWNWKGALTPFGIAGSWGDMSFGGWFWLWKRAWSKRPVPDP